MGVKTRLTFLAVSPWDQVADVQSHTCPPQYIHTHSETHTHTYTTQKALQGSVSSQAKNPSWGNPKGAQLYHRLSPSNPVGSENPERSCCTTGGREEEVEGRLFCSQSCTVVLCPCGESEDGRRTNSDTGALHDFGRDEAPAEPGQLRAHTLYHHKNTLSGIAFPAAHLTVEFHQL